MHAIVAILLIAAIVVVAVVVDRVRAAGQRAVARTVFRGRHHEGQASVRTRATFTAPVGVEALRRHVISTINPWDKPPAAVPGLYLAGQTNTGVELAFGSKLGTSFRASLTFTGSGKEPTAGTFHILNWTETDGLVNAANEMRQIAARVATAVAELGGTFETDGQHEMPAEDGVLDREAG